LPTPAPLARRPPRPRPLPPDAPRPDPRPLRPRPQPDLRRVRAVLRHRDPARPPVPRPGQGAGRTGGPPGRALDSRRAPRPHLLLARRAAAGGRGLARAPQHPPQPPPPPVAARPLRG